MIKTLLLEILNIEVQSKILLLKCATDSKSLHDAICFYKTVTEHRLKTELRTIQESLEKQEIQTVIWVCSKDQLAESCTKEGPSHEKLCDAASGKIKACVLYFNITKKST